MSKRQDQPGARRAREAMLGIILAAGAMQGTAIAGTAFTWDPGVVVPGAAAFTADAIDATHYLYAVGPPTTPLPSPTYTVNFLEQITSFSLGGGASFVPTGLNGTGAGSYGLYLTMQLQTQAVGPPDIYHYLSGTAALMLDPGNNNGAASATTAGLMFANTTSTGAGDDIPLATGTLVSGHFTLNPAPGIRSVGDFFQTFQPAAAEAGFFVTPVSPHDEIEVVDTTPNINPEGVPALVISADPNLPGYNFNVLNGGSAVMDFTVPEPASLLLLGSGLIGLAALRTRNNRPR